MSHVSFETPDDLSIIVDHNDESTDGPSTLSPRTLDAILHAGEPSLDDLRASARLLTATLQIRTKNHKEEVQHLQDRVDDLEGQAACDETFGTPPPGYIENSLDRALGLLIPGPGPGTPHPWRRWSL